ncbi:hypothetical protein TNCV_3379531 [Trichonephila clavipes]|nr:hypothetical protein TNCV_3379531 [Trichonephila clavipes]
METFAERIPCDKCALKIRSELWFFTTKQLSSIKKKLWQPLGWIPREKAFKSDEKRRVTVLAALYETKPMDDGMLSYVDDSQFNVIDECEILVSNMGSYLER